MVWMDFYPLLLCFLSYSSLVPLFLFGVFLCFFSCSIFLAEDRDRPELQQPQPLELKITNNPLKGPNFFQWPEAVQLFLNGNQRLGFLPGNIPRTPAVLVKRRYGQRPAFKFLAGLQPGFEPLRLQSFGIANQGELTHGGSFGGRDFPLTGHAFSSAHIATVTPSAAEDIVQVHRSTYDRLLSPQAAPLFSGAPCSSSSAATGTSPSVFHSTLSDSWIVDTGATNHMTGKSHLFSSIASFHPSGHVKLADGNRTPISGVGTMVMAVFSYIYYQSFITSRSISVEMIMEQILRNLSIEEQMSLHNLLGKVVEERQLA